MQTSTALAPVHNGRRVSTLLAHATFLPTGAITVMLGPLLPTLTARWSLTDTQAGYFVTAQFLGALLGTIATSGVISRFGFCRTIAAGQLLMALGAATLMAGNFAASLVSVLCYGAGIGLTIPTVNLMVAAENPVQRSSALNLLNFSWSAGAVACPLLLALLNRDAISIFLSAVTLALVLLTVLVLLFGSNLPKSQDEYRSVVAESLFRSLRGPAVVILGAIFFLYVGTENALSAWLASYAKRASLTTNTGWITVPSYFFAALLLGRALAPLILRRWDDQQQSRVGLVLALASTGCLLLSHSVPAIAACAFFAGLGLSTLYPIAIGSVSAGFGDKASQVGGAMFALSTLGGACVPWLLGFASTELRSLRTALIIPVIGCLLMLFLYSSPLLHLRKVEAIQD